MADQSLSYQIIFAGINQAVAGLTKLGSTVSSVASQIRSNVQGINAALGGIKAPNVGATGFGQFTQGANAATTAAGGAGAALNNLGNAANGATPGINSASGALKALAGIEIAEKLLEAGKILIELSDDATTAFNRIQSSTRTMNEAEGAFTGIKQVAIDTRQPLEAVAESFQQVTLATNALGLSYRDQVGITKELNELLVVSGASGQKAKNGVSDLLRGLAAGKITSQELRGMVHDVPALGQSIAEGLGVGVGALKELAKQGKLTPEAIIGALNKVNPEVQATFGKLTPTIAGGFQSLKDGIEGVIHDFNDLTGVGGGFGALLQTIGNHAGVLATTLAGIGTVLIASVLPEVLEFSAALLASPIGAIAVSVGVLSAALGYLGEQSFTVGGQTASGFQIASAVLETIGDTIKTVIAAFGVFFQSTDQGASTFESVLKGAFAVVAEAAKAAANFFIASWVGSFDLLKDLYGDFPGFMNLAFTATVNLAIAAAERVLNVWQGALRGVASVAGEIAPSVGSAINGALDKLTIHLPRAQASAEGKAFGATIGSEVKTAFSTDYVAKFGTAVVGHLKTITASAKAAQGALSDVHGGTAADGDDDKTKKKAQAISDYAKEVTKLKNAIYDEGLTATQLALADAFDEVGLKRDITLTGQKADAIRALVTQLQAAHAARQVTDELTKLQLANYELQQSEEDRAKVEARIAAGLPTDLKVITDKTKAIDDQAAANYRLAESNKNKDKQTAGVTRIQDGLKDDQIKNKGEDDARADKNLSSLTKAYTAIDRVVAKRKEEVAALKLSTAEQDKLNAEIDKQAADNKVEAKLDDQADKVEKLKGFLTDLWENPKAAMKKFFTDFLTNILTAIAKATILKGLLGPGQSSSGGFGSILSGALGSALGFGGGKAVGGSVSGSNFYMVGENGPELFAPGRSGTIIPNHNMPGSGASNISVGGSTIVVNGAMNDNMMNNIKAQQAAQMRYVVETIDKRVAYHKARGNMR